MAKPEKETGGKLVAWVQVEDATRPLNDLKKWGALENKTHWFIKQMILLDEFKGYDGIEGPWHRMKVGHLNPEYDWDWQQWVCLKCANRNITIVFDIRHAQLSICSPTKILKQKTVTKNQNKI